MMGLTKRQSEALAFIRGFIEAHGYSPSYDEIGVALGLRPKSKGTVHAVVHRLVERGALEIAPNRARSISLPRAAA